MTDNQRKLIFEYMGYKLINGYHIDERNVVHYLNDGNDMITAMNKMVVEGDWEEFIQDSDNREWGKTHNFIHWIMQPTRFFELFGEWLEER